MEIDKHEVPVFPAEYTNNCGIDRLSVHGFQMRAGHFFGTLFGVDAFR